MTRAPGIAALIVCCGVAAAATADSPGEVPQEGFLSTLKQAFKEDFNHEVVRGHFDVGAAPDVHRYYCLVDAKSGRRESKAVSGEPVKRPDGMTGIKASAVTLYGCDSAEQHGILVTTPYVLTGAAAIPPASSASAAPPPPRPAVQTPVEPASTMPDVSGIRLGMSVDEVRTVLRSKRLPDLYESTEQSGAADAVEGHAKPGMAGRFTNVMAAWSPPTDGGSESYTVMFTPVPGRERALAVIHVIEYSAGTGPHEPDLDQALLRKYSGFAAAADVPAAATWRMQTGGGVQVGDPCGRRGLFGGPAVPREPMARVDNVALKTTHDEFRYQLDQCGAAIVTADHLTANPAAPPAERVVTRLRVSAYSPAIAFDGSTSAAQALQASGGGTRAPASRSPGSNVPSL